jgi:hypothetical protein
MFLMSGLHRQIRFCVKYKDRGNFENLWNTLKCYVFDITIAPWVQNMLILKLTVTSDSFEEISSANSQT